MITRLTPQHILNLLECHVFYFRPMPPKPDSQPLSAADEGVFLSVMLAHDGYPLPAAAQFIGYFRVAAALEFDRRPAYRPSFPLFLPDGHIGVAFLNCRSILAAWRMASSSFQPERWRTCWASVPRQSAHGAAPSPGAAPRAARTAGRGKFTSRWCENGAACRA